MSGLAFLIKNYLKTSWIFDQTIISVCCTIAAASLLVTALSTAVKRPLLNGGRLKKAMLLEGLVVQQSGSW